MADVFHHECHAHRYFLGPGLRMNIWQTALYPLDKCDAGAFTGVPRIGRTDRAAGSRSAFISADTVEAATEPNIGICPPPANWISITPLRSGNGDPVRSGNDVGAASAVTVTALNTDGVCAARNAAGRLAVLTWTFEPASARFIDERRRGAKTIKMDDSSINVLSLRRKRWQRPLDHF